ncbi:uncharacterized protein B0I36DRAFT_309573 [Microdochium trichocladiopsis]|uniref:Uncharacterized protein n=1 Tax=Microdochium trichocladiopsis TaxID=1682393 RepID=A0A9P9BVT4_9PEZI|nr:uncharacterized protein B0I36DRAFT_309573 [Microdochium trichocladiopsis]KAH7039900.1 hypothetical protein B0I36DRAFT_309573 [Microdochium trichocladiopsis]
MASSVALRCPYHGLSTSFPRTTGLAIHRQWHRHQHIPPRGCACTATNVHRNHGVLVKGHDLRHRCSPEKRN